MPKKATAGAGNSGRLHATAKSPEATFSGGILQELMFHWLSWIGCTACSAAISWSVLRPLIASLATLALNSGLWVRRLLMGGIPLSGIGAPPHRLTMDPVQKSQSTSVSTWSLSVGLV